MNIERMIIGAFAVNTYLIFNEDTKEAFVIDPGACPKELLQRLEDKKLLGILLTHGHMDHIGGVKELLAAHPAPVYAGANERALLSDPRLNLSGMMGGPISLKADVEVNDGDTIPFGKENIEVMALPGHTAGGVGYLIGNVIFSGDTLFQGSIGRTDFPTGDYETLIRSVEEKIFECPDETLILSGHGEKTTVGIEKTTNPFFL